MSQSHSQQSHRGHLHRETSPTNTWIFAPEPDDRRVLEWSHVSLQISDRPVLSDVSCWIRDEELTCLCGANGAGKTQLIRIGLGLIQPTLGKSLLFSRDPIHARRNVGYVPQLKLFNRNFPARAVDLIVASKIGRWPLWTRREDRDEAASALRQVGGLHLLDKDIGGLSGGEMQRVFFARALVTQPKLLILDEPFAAVDTKGRAELLDELHRLKSTSKVAIVLITHSQAIVEELADRVIFLEKGRLVGWGAKAQVMACEELREVAFFGHDHEHAIEAGDH
jgi:zinc transport system ATP-binding protein